MNRASSKSCDLRPIFPNTYFAERYSVNKNAYETNEVYILFYASIRLLRLEDTFNSVSNYISKFENNSVCVLRFQGNTTAPIQ